MVIAWLKLIILKSFADAISFMVRVAFYAEILEHYPIWENNHTSILVRIGTADQHAVQSRDVQLAKRMQSAFCCLILLLPKSFLKQTAFFKMPSGVPLLFYNQSWYHSRYILIK